MCRWSTDRVQSAGCVRNRRKVPGEPLSMPLTLKPLSPVTEFAFASLNCSNGYISEFQFPCTSCDHFCHINQVGTWVGTGLTVAMVEAGTAPLTLQILLRKLPYKKGDGRLTMS